MIYEKIDRPQMILGMHEFLKGKINALESAVKSKDNTLIQIAKGNYKKASLTASSVIRPIGLQEYNSHYSKLLKIKE